MFKSLRGKMNDIDIRLKTIKDQIAAALGQIDDASNNPKLKSNKEMLIKVAKELHKTADELVWTVARINSDKKS